MHAVPQLSVRVAAGLTALACVRTASAADLTNAVQTIHDPATAKQYASSAVIFQGPQATIRWAGTESGKLPYPAWNSLKSQWSELSKGTSVGRKRIDRFASVQVQRVRLRVGRSAAEPLIRSLAVFYAP